MIAKLSGRLDALLGDAAIIDVGGVGYLVFCSARTLSALPAVGEAAAVHVETHVREDHIHLYGFATEGERDWFRLLTTVQGVGARVGLAILSALAPGELAAAIAGQDGAMLTRASGVGPKLGGRIVTELKDKAGAIGGDPVVAAAAAAASGNTVDRDAISGLVNLGYKQGEAANYVGIARRMLGDDADTGELINFALREMAAR